VITVRRPPIDSTIPATLPMTTDPKRGNFFAVDRRAWHHVCGLGGINPAIAYLVMARGTGGDNRTTSWSVNATEKHTPIARSRAKAAVGCLVEAGAVTKTSGGDRPRYYLTPAHEIPVLGLRSKLDAYEAGLVKKVKRGERIGKVHLPSLRQLVGQGHLSEADGHFTIAPEPGSTPEWIWLPNELVSGAVGETPPIAWIHHSGDVMQLRMFIDFYDTQNLVENGGVSCTLLWKKFSRVEIGRYGEFIIFGFRQAGAWVRWKSITLCHRRKLTADEKAADENEGRDFWRRLGRLIDLGLVEWVPHLVDNESDETEIIHPYGTGDSDSIEDRLGRLAHQAAVAVLTDAQRDRAIEHDHRLAPILATDFPEVQMIGVLRMRYRAKSSLTAAWMAKNEERGEVYIAVYERLIARATQRGAAIA
jgi:hypothetical protein